MRRADGGVRRHRRNVRRQRDVNARAAGHRAFRRDINDRRDSGEA